MSTPPRPESEDPQLGRSQADSQPEQSAPAQFVPVAPPAGEQALARDDAWGAPAAPDPNAPTWGQESTPGGALGAQPQTSGFVSPAAPLPPSGGMTPPATHSNSPAGQFGQSQFDQNQVWQGQYPPASRPASNANSYLPGFDPRSGQWNYIQPGIVGLHPLSFADILSGAFAMLRYAPGKLIAAWATFMIPTSIILGIIGMVTYFTVGNPFTLEADGDHFVALLYAFLQGAGATMIPAFFSPLVMAAAAGKTPSVRACIREFFAAFGALVLASLLFGVGYLLLATPQIFLSPVAYMVFSLLATLLYLPLSLWAGITGIVAVQEGRFTGDSLRRSLQLLKQSFWRGIGVLFVYGMLIGTVMGLLTVVFMLLGFGLMIHEKPGAGLVVLFLVIAFLVAAAVVVIGAIQVGLFGLIYLDARFRQDGLDFQWLDPRQNQPVLGP